MNSSKNTSNLHIQEDLEKQKLLSQFNQAKTFILEGAKKKVINEIEKEMLAILNDVKETDSLKKLQEYYDKLILIYAKYSSIKKSNNPSSSENKNNEIPSPPIAPVLPPAIIQDQKQITFKERLDKFMGVMVTVPFAEALEKFFKREWNKGVTRKERLPFPDMLSFFEMSNEDRIKYLCIGREKKESMGTHDCWLPSFLSSLSFDSYTKKGLLHGFVECNAFVLKCVGSPNDRNYPQYFYQIKENFRHLKTEAELAAEFRQQQEQEAIQRREELRQRAVRAQQAADEKLAQRLQRELNGFTLLRRFPGIRVFYAFGAQGPASKTLARKPMDIEQAIWDVIPEEIKREWENLNKELQEHILKCLEVNLEEVFSKLDNTQDLGQTFKSPISLSAPKIPVRLPSNTKAGEVKADVNKPFDLFDDVIKIGKKRPPGGNEEKYRHPLLPNIYFDLKEVLPAPDALKELQERAQIVLRKQNEKSGPAQSGP